MAGKNDGRDQALTSYVRLRIREWKETQGRDIQDIARAGGISKSHPSQVLGGSLGVGGKTAHGYARAFGFNDAEDLRRAAYVWWMSEGEAGAKAAAAPHTPAMREAVEMLLSLGQGTREQLETILTAYAHPRFHDRDRDWWTLTLGAELQRDRATISSDAKARAATNAAQRRVREANQERRPKEVARERPSRPAKARKAAG